MASDVLDPDQAALLAALDAGVAAAPAPGPKPDAPEGDLPAFLTAPAPKAPIDRSERFRKLTRYTIDVIERLLKEGMPVKMACQAAGITDKTLYSWLDAAVEGDPDPLLAELFERMTRARARQDYESFHLLRAAALRGDFKAIEMMLRAQRGDVYNAKQTVDVKVEQTQTGPDFKKFSDEDWAKWREAEKTMQTLTGRK